MTGLKAQGFATRAGMNSDDFARLFDTAVSSVFRLETLPAYSTAEEADLIADLLAGRPLPDWTPADHDLFRQIAEDTAAGKRWQRVHVVNSPLTDYLRYELAVYRYGTAAGEDIRIANRDAHPDLDGLREDFWLFDDQILALMRYDGEGRFLGVDLAGADVDLDEYRRRRDVALAHSVPLDEYGTDHREPRSA